jgi:hypothetical protein
VTRPAPKRIVLRHGQPGPTTLDDVRTNYVYRGSQPHVPQKNKTGKRKPKLQVVSIEEYAAMRGEAA